MIGVIIVGVISGILMMIMETIITINPYAQNLYKVFKPIMRTTINIPLNFLLYLVSGCVLATIYLFLCRILPGEIGIVKGISFAFFVWYFRSFISVLFQWSVIPLPGKAIVYALITGLSELIVIGVLYGLTLKKMIFN